MSKQYKVVNVKHISRFDVWCPQCNHRLGSHMTASPPTMHPRPAFCDSYGPDLETYSCVIYCDCDFTVQESLLDV